MVAVVKDNGNITVFDDVGGFAYSADENEITIQREVFGDGVIDCSLSTVEIMSGFGGYPEYNFLSDEDKRLEAKEEAEKAARKAFEAKNNTDVCVAEPRFMDPLAELEFTIREWCMDNGYTDDDDEWFEVNIDSRYKKKVLVVNILPSYGVKRGKSVFEGENTGDMFHKAMAFFRGGCQ